MRSADGYLGERPTIDRNPRLPVVVSPPTVHGTSPRHPARVESVSGDLNHPHIGNVQLALMARPPTANPVLGCQPTSVRNPCRYLHVGHRRPGMPNSSGGTSNLPVGVAPPTLGVAVGSHPTGVSKPGADLGEPPGGWVGTTVPVGSPAGDRATVGPQAATVRVPDGYLVQGNRRRPGLVLGVQPPTHRPTGGSHPTRVPVACLNRPKRNVGRHRLAVVAQSPTFDPPRSRIAAGMSLSGGQTSEPSGWRSGLR